MARPNAPGWLIVIEGIDGTGKSTLVRKLADYCEAEGLSCVTGAEPTRGPWGQKLRRTMTEGRLTLEEELDLFLKDRGEHVAGVIRPALQRGDVVVLDRYYFSTAAYQGARGVDPEWILAENEKFAPQPDLVLLLDVDPAAGQGRIRARGDAPNSFEELGQLREVRRIFQSLNRPYIRQINAATEPEKVWQECRAIFEEVRTAR